MQPRCHDHAAALSALVDADHPEAGVVAVVTYLLYRRLPPRTLGFQSARAVRCVYRRATAKGGWAAAEQAVEQLLGLRS